MVMFTLFCFQPEISSDLQCQSHQQGTQNFIPPLLLNTNFVKEKLEVLTSSDNFDLLDLIFPERVFLIKKEKSEHPH